MDPASRTDRIAPIARSGGPLPSDARLPDYELSRSTALIRIAVLAPSWQCVRRVQGPLYVSNSPAVGHLDEYPETPIIQCIMKGMRTPPSPCGIAGPSSAREACRRLSGCSIGSRSRALAAHMHALAIVRDVRLVLTGAVGHLCPGAWLPIPERVAASTKNRVSRRHSLNRTELKVSVFNIGFVSTAALAAEGSGAGWYRLAHDAYCETSPDRCRSLHGYRIRRPRLKLISIIKLEQRPFSAGADNQLAGTVSQGVR